MSPDDRDGSGEVPADEREDRPELDIDSAFAAIVAGWGEPAAGKDTGRSDRTTGAVGAVDEPPDDEPADPPVIRPVSGPLIPRIGAPPEPDLPEDERFVPPEPPPLPRGDLVTRLAWAGVVGGPVFLLIAAMFWREVSQWLLIAAVAAFIGGFLTLVLRMPRDRAADDSDDDGAVV